MASTTDQRIAFEEKIHGMLDAGDGINELHELLDEHFERWQEDQENLDETTS
jgi:hypothetical protein